MGNCIIRSTYHTVFISNASSHNVYVKVHSDIKYPKSSKVGVDANAGTLGGIGVQVSEAAEWIASDKLGYTVVSRYSLMEFHPDAPKRVCYVTIKVKTPSGYKFICENHSLQVERGFIIDTSCYIHMAKRDDRWTDIDGNMHKPDLHNRGELPKDEDCTQTNDYRPGTNDNRTWVVIDCNKMNEDSSHMDEYNRIYFQ